MKPTTRETPRIRHRRGSASCSGSSSARSRPTGWVTPATFHRRVRSPARGPWSGAQVRGRDGDRPGAGRLVPCVRRAGGAAAQHGKRVRNEPDGSVACASRATPPRSTRWSTGAAPARGSRASSGSTYGTLSDQASCRTTWSIAAMSRLIARDEEVLRAAPVGGARAREIGEVLGLPGTVVRPRLSRARARLRELLGNDPPAAGHRPGQATNRSSRSGDEFSTDRSGRLRAAAHRGQSRATWRRSCPQP